MLNVSKNVRRTLLRRKLRGLAEEALREQGWTVERLPKMTTSVRRISKNGESKTISIRTSQNTWIAFPRTKDDKRWRTLSKVDAVVAASVEDPSNPQFAKIHLLDVNDVRERFDRAYKARLTAGRKIPVGRGVWVSLYDDETDQPVSMVGAGLAKDPETLIARVPLDGDGANGGDLVTAITPDDDDAPLTIAEAKRRLAKTLGVDLGSIKITVEA